MKFPKQHETGAAEACRGGRRNGAAQAEVAGAPRCQQRAQMEGGAGVAPVT
jgi:hypothetical protein